MNVINNNYYIFWKCICSLRCTAYNAHASYCRLWPVWFYHFSPTLSHKRQDILEIVVVHNVCFDCLSKFLWYFSVVTRIEHDITTNVLMCSCKNLLYFSDYNFFLISFISNQKAKTIASYKLMCRQSGQWSRRSSIDVASVCRVEGPSSF